jgi:hypothetical protein
MKNEQFALDALEQLKKAADKLEQTYISYYLKTKLRGLVMQIEKEIDLTDID